MGYVYVSAAPYEKELHGRVCRYLAEKQIEIQFDETVFDGVFWTSDRQEKIAHCGLFLEVLGKDSGYLCPCLDSARVYAEECGKKIIKLKTENLDDTQLREALATLPNLDDEQNENEPKDLWMRFLEKYTDRDVPYAYRTKLLCNLRTHEVRNFNLNVFRDGQGEPILLSDERLYCAITYHADAYCTFITSRLPDYRQTADDRFFCMELVERRDRPPQQLASTYRFLRDHPRIATMEPFMDEFEYIGRDD